MGLESIVVGDSNLYDALIIGGGPAGLSAALYLARANKRVGFIEKNNPGGKLVSIAEIKNYPGFANVSGNDLAMSFFNQATEAGAEYIWGDVIKIDQKQGYQIVYTREGNTMYAKTLIIASGTTETKLGVRGENEYLQKGISYCVLCDGILAKNCKTAVIGSNQSAVGSVKYLAGIASKLYFVVLDESIDVSDVPNNVEIIKGSKISLFSGNGRALTSMLLSGAVSKEIMIDYAFIINGISASTDFINNKELLTNDNIIKVDNSNKNTAIPGIFSAGDVSRSSNKQVVTAVSDGAIAATSAIAYINSKFKK